MTRRLDMTKGPILKSLILFALPLMLSDLLQQLYSLMDGIVVGRYVGSDALAAIGTTGSFCYMLIGFFMGLSGGGGVVISQFYGAGDKPAMRRAIHTSLMISLMGGTFLTFFGVFITPYALQLINVPPEILPMATDYLMVTFAGSIGLTVYNMGAGILRAMGDSVRPLLYLAASSVFNIGLNLFFVLVMDLGVLGVALGTLIAQFISMGMVLHHLLTTDKDYRVSLEELSIDRSMAGRILRIGIPAGLQYMMMDVSNVLIQSCTNSFGAIAIAGDTASGRINGFCYLPLNALGMAATTFVGQNVGAGNIDRMHKGGMTALKAAFISSTFLGVLCAVFAYPLLSIITTDPAVMDVGALMLRTIAPTYGIYAIIANLSGTVRGAGYSVPPMLITLVCLCFFRIGWIFLMKPVFGDMRVVAYCYPISWTLGAIGQGLYYRFGSWRKDLERRYAK